MAMTVTMAAQVPGDVPVLGIPVYAGRRPVARAGAELDAAFLAGRGFEGKPGDVLAVPADDGSTIVALGVGEPAGVTTEILRRAAAAFVRTAGRDDRAATTLLAAAPRGLDVGAAAQAVAEGAILASYRFSRYKADSKPCRIESFVVVGSGGTVRAAIDRGARVARGVMLARDLVNEPAGAMTPTLLAAAAVEMADREGLDSRVLDEPAVTEMGLGGLLGVSRGSAEPPRLIELVYEPPSPRATLALVGKGITFDSGGLSIKTAEGMETMKTDKAGGAAVIGAMSVLPSLAPDVKVVALVPASENMPSGTATKPGDVLRTRNGKTVEVLNTDAEGRLILADALALAAEGKPDAIVDLATLTGACVIALGRRVAGLMGNHPGWISQMAAAGERSGELLWHLPLPQEYRRSIDSEIADLKNISSGRYGGTLTAGLFLQEFVAGVPWVHLDIAGPARSEEEDGYLNKGGTGFGVRTLVEAVGSFQPPGPA